MKLRITDIPRSIIIPSFMTIGSQMPELDRGGGGGAICPPPYKIGSQNTPYKLGLSCYVTRNTQDFSITANVIVLFLLGVIKDVILIGLMTTLPQFM